MGTIGRRDFLKASASLGAFMITSGRALRSYAVNSNVQVACIGTGGQGSYHLRAGLAGTPDLQIIAIADVFEPHQKSGTLYGQISNAKVPLAAGQAFNSLSHNSQAAAQAANRPDAYYDYKEMLNDKGDAIDAVVISTPFTTHFPITMDCLNAKKFVFCEKTMVQTIEQGRDVVRKCHETGKFVQVGHQRRYNPKYNKAMDLVYNKRAVGRITHVTAQWHRNNDWRRHWQEEYTAPDGGPYVLNDDEKKFIPDLERHLNWRMYNETSGGLYTELATHQTDVANWFLQAVPSRVYAMGGLDYWRDGRQVDDNIVIDFEYDERPGAPGFLSVDQRSNLQDPIKINKAYKVRFAYSSILANQKRGATELIQGDLGSLELSETDCKAYAEPEGIRNFESATGTTVVFTGPTPRKKSKNKADPSSITSGGSKDPQKALLAAGVPLLDKCAIEEADVYQFRAFAHHIRNGGKPRTNEMTGFTTALGVIAALQSQKEDRPVKIDPAWYAFDFAAPSFTDFEFDQSKYKCPDAAKKTAKKPAAKKSA